MSSRKRARKLEDRYPPYKRDVDGIAYYRVRLGKRVTGGTSIEKYFRSEGEAREFIRQFGVTKTNEGRDSASLNLEQRADAVKALALLNGHGSLTEAASCYLRYVRPEGGVKTFNEAAQAYVDLREKKRRKARYLTNLRSQFRILGEAFGQKPVSQIHQEELEKWLATREISEKTGNNYIITLRALGNFSVLKKWAPENVALHIEFATLEDVPVGILTVEEATRLLEAARMELGGVMLPAVAIGLFVGIRRSEICQLEWKSVKPKAIEVPASVSKTRTRRLVDIQPVLNEWLDLCQRTSDRVFDGSEDSYGENLRFLAKIAKIEWRHNAIRHSAASYLLALKQDAAYVALQLGHTEDILFRHYREIVTQEEAARYHAILPQKVGNDVGPIVD